MERHAVRDLSARGSTYLTARPTQRMERRIRFYVETQAEGEGLKGASRGVRHIITRIDAMLGDGVRANRN